MDVPRNASYYQEHLEEINQKLENLGDKRQDLNNRLQEIEERKEKAYQRSPSLEQLIEVTKLEIEENKVSR